jgi:ankyrin repeat protein
MNHCNQNSITSIAKKKDLKLGKVILSSFLIILSFPACFAEIKTEQAMTPQMVFVESVQKGLVDSVQKYISESVIDPNQIFEDGTRPLHVAVINNQEPVVALLIQAGAGLNEKDSTTLATPLHLAALYSRKSIAKLLIEKGADINATMKFGITPLMVAAQFSHPQIIELLVKAKAKINQADDEGFTALHCAAQTGDEITAKLLLQSGARLDARDRMHATPLMIAKQNNKNEMAQLLSGEKPLTGENPVNPE